MPRAKTKLPVGGLKVIRHMCGNGAREVDIAAKLGMAWQTFDRLRKEDIRIQRALAEGNAAGHEKIIGVLFDRALNHGDTIAAIFLSKIKYGYREGVNVEHHGNINLRAFTIPQALTTDTYGQIIEHSPELLAVDPDGE